MRRCSLFLLTLAWAKGNGVSPRVLHKHLLFHRWAILDRAWVEVKVEDRDLKQGLQRPQGRVYVVVLLIELADQSDV